MTVQDPLRFLYADLLEAPRAAERVEGVDRWRQHHGAPSELLPLLDDDAPLVRSNETGRLVVTEVRMIALAAIQARYRGSSKEWDLGPVLVRAPMPAEHVLHRATDLLVDIGTEQRELLLSGVDKVLDGRVQPLPEHDATCRGYVLLQTLGEVPYLRQLPEAGTLLTPVQLEWEDWVMAGPRPRPHLRFDGDDGSVGYLYADHSPGAWVIDLDDGSYGRTVRAYLGLVLRSERGGVPRVGFGDDGRPRVRSDGRLVVSGVLPHDTPEVIDYLRSVAAFVSRRHPVELVV
jgi:hypothetical protein